MADTERSFYFGWQSSDVDWCEHNYQITHLVAEFWNTVSNVLFFVFPPLLIYLFRQYSQQVKWGVNVVWMLLVFVGLGSVYFHATLSLVGQLLDEIAIIWVFMAAVALWWPRKSMPAFLQEDRLHFKLCMLLCSAVTSGLACVMPSINCVVLMFLGVPACAMLIIQLKKCSSRVVYNLGWRCCLMWLIALSSWISDRFFCHLWEQIRFPYLHCVWHIFIFLASYQACILYAFFDAEAEVPEQLPIIRYWPNDHWGWLGIPYITLLCAGSKPCDKIR